jgi:hypothetical protein
MSFFRESEKFWTKSALALCKRFSGSGLTYWTDAVQHCSIAALQHCSIAALQQMESTWNEVNNRPLNYSWQRSDLEMLILSCDAPCIQACRLFAWRWSALQCRAMGVLTRYSVDI